MAVEEANYGVLVPGGASVPGGDLLIRDLDQAAKGKASVAKESASSYVGDNAAAMLDRLNLTTQESTAFVHEEDDEDYPGCPSWALVGKVLAPNTLHVSTINAALRPAWGNPRGLDFHPLGANRFLAEFGSKAHKDWVCEGSPWTISKHCIMLKEFYPSLKPSDVCFDTLSLWVRILNLPFGLMNDDRGERDAEGLLPYHSSRLCASDDKKKKYSGATMGQHSNSKNSKSGSSDGVKAPNKAPSRAHEKESVGVAVSGKIVQISGKKQKVYQPKVQVQHEVQEPSPLPMILECNFTGDIFLLLRFVSIVQQMSM
ncbi:hypothetical protein D1007_48068 [Hordeum vulgare]|nr:hypothetical protein D1007_48068 [Hordeum vulgare]